MYKSYRKHISTSQMDTNKDGKDDISKEEPNTASLEFIDLDQNVKKTPSNLQEAFMKYRKKRQKDIKRIRKVKHSPGELQLKARADPRRMQWLRMKFLEQSKKYFGVPYAKKYWTKDKDEYYSPIFLDCCGLVRRCMRDLKRDFGFRIGPWNQAYMHDTLPITIESEDDMQPGDLVFISATYYSKKSKKQPHNMTHVEIWLGDGPKTIGARWNNGKVQVFDSYKFNAKSYHSESYIFKSIDTWLMGICRSHCPDHMWKTRNERFKPSKKSVFSVSESQEEEADQSAGDSDDEITTIASEGSKNNEIHKSDLGIGDLNLNVEKNIKDTCVQTQRSESVDAEKGNENCETSKSEKLEMVEDHDNDEIETNNVETKMCQTLEGVSVLESSKADEVVISYEENKSSQYTESDNMMDKATINEIICQNETSVSSELEDVKAEFTGQQ